MARLQPAGDGGSAQSRASAARTAAFPVDLGQQPRRILHGPRRGAEGSAAPGNRRSVGRRPLAGTAARRNRGRGAPPRRPAAERMAIAPRSEEHTSELQSLMRNSYAVFCLKKKNIQKKSNTKDI